MISRNIQGWTRGTEDRISHLYMPNTKWEKLRQVFVRTHASYNLSLQNLRETLENILKNYPLEPIIVDPEKNKKRLTYRGIGLTSRPDSDEPIYEAAQYFSADGQFVSSAKSMGKDGLENSGTKGSDFERQFTEVNSVAPELAKKLKNMFKKWQVTKVRIMELHPNGVVPPHYDHPYYQQIRLHAVIDTNPDVFWEIEGQQFQIPADGSLYWFDIGRIHSVYNFGKTPRSVLSLHLCPPLSSDGTPLAENLLKDLEEGTL